MATSNVTDIGAMNSDSSGCPPSSGLAFRVHGITPNTNRIATGRPIAMNDAVGSRRNSFASVAASARTADGVVDMAGSAFLGYSQRLARERDEDVIQRGLVNA